VGVDHRRPHVLVPQQFLDRLDVAPGLEQVGGEGMPQGMRGHALRDARFPGRLLDGPLQAGRVNGMAADLAAAGVHRTLSGGEKIRKRYGQMNSRAAWGHFRSRALGG